MKTVMNSRLRFYAYKQKNWLKRVLRPSRLVLGRLPHQARLLFARIMVRLFPFISIDPDRLYPPAQACDSTSRWVSSAGRQFKARIWEIDPACTVSNPLPKTMHQAIRRQFLMDQTYDYPETFVASIPKGRVTNRGFVITPDRQLLNDVSTYFHDPGKTITGALSDDWRLKPLSKIDGRVAVLATDGANLYYHWLFQLLPRYELIRRAGINLRDIDFFLVNAQKSGFQRETLASLGIAPSKIIDGDSISHIRASELVVPSVPLGGGCFRPWMTDFLRETFLPKNPRAIRPLGQRFYISRARAGYRRILNEGAV